VIPRFASIAGALTCLSTALLAACSSQPAGSTAASSASSSASSTSGIGGSGQGGGGGGAPILNPHLFDCTAKSIPDRASTTPIGCGLDRTCTTRQVSGHRGAGGQLGKIAPEDTLAAYRAGIALGVDYVETDPRPTKDGILVNMHDTTVDRTTDGTGTVDQMTFAEVRALHPKSSDFPGDFSCEMIPTLEEILTTCKGRVVVLVDANKTDRVDLLVGAIQKAGALDWAIFDTSSTVKIDQALMLEPKLHTQIRVTSVADLDAQLAHFSNSPPVIVEVETTAPISATAAEVHAKGNRAMMDVFPDDLAAGLDGDVSHYAEAFAAGIDIVQSDRPDLVLKYLGRF
jgi:glycerophosphoryl diester phosphodiesterase